MDVASEAVLKYLVTAIAIRDTVYINQGGVGGARATVTTAVTAVTAVQSVQSTTRLDTNTDTCLCPLTKHVNMSSLRTQARDYENVRVYIRKWTRT
jgi:hypothetical protein